jgi:hypothetical protein
MALPVPTLKNPPDEMQKLLLGLLGIRWSANPNGARLVVPVPGEQRFLLVTVLGWTIAIDCQPPSA